MSLNNDSLRNPFSNEAERAEAEYQAFSQMIGADIIVLTNTPLMNYTGIGQNHENVNRGPDGNMWAYALLTAMTGGLPYPLRGVHIGKLRDYVTYEFVCKEVRRVAGETFDRPNPEIMNADVTLARAATKNALGNHVSLLSILVRDESNNWVIRNASVLQDNAPLGDVEHPRVIVVERGGNLVERETKCMSGPVQGVKGVYEGLRVDRPLFMTVMLYDGTIRCAALYCSTTLCHYGKKDPDSCFIRGTQPEKWWSAQCYRSNKGIEITSRIDEHRYLPWDTGLVGHRETTFYPGEKIWEEPGFKAVATHPALMTEQRYVLAIDTMSSKPNTSVLVSSPECFPSHFVGDLPQVKSFDMCQIGVYFIAFVCVLFDGSPGHIIESVFSLIVVTICTPYSNTGPKWPRALATAGFVGGSFGGPRASSLAFGTLCVVRMVATAESWATVAIHPKTFFEVLTAAFAAFSAAPAVALLANFGTLVVRTNNVPVSATIFTFMSGLCQLISSIEKRPWLLGWSCIQIIEGVHGAYHYSEASEAKDYVTAQRKLVEAGLGFFGRCLTKMPGYANRIMGMPQTPGSSPMGMPQIPGSSAGSETVLMTLPNGVGIRKSLEYNDWYLHNERAHYVTTSLVRSTNIPEPLRLFNNSTSADQLRTCLLEQGEGERLEVIPVGDELFPVC